MDTIQVSIILNKNRLSGITHDELQGIGRYINSTTSPYGYRYCDFLEISNTGNLIIKISYPRFFAGINAFLISNKDQCTEVQSHFSTMLMNSPLHDTWIQLSRVDIPFTFVMHNDYEFYSYRKIYQIFDYVYRMKNIKSNPKAYTNIKEFKPETLIYADTPTISGYNKKILIYDQFNNLKAKTGDEEELYNFEARYENLQRRMRIEVSKRIDRKEILIKDFQNYKIFETYVPQYKKYIFDNILDLNEIENFYNEKSNELADRFLKYREETNNFLYETFIYREIENIYDYEIIRRALKIHINNLKTREKAITAVRKVLMNYEYNENIIVMETYEAIKEIRATIKKSFI